MRGLGHICTLNTVAFYLVGKMELFPQLHLKSDIHPLLERFCFGFLISSAHLHSNLIVNSFKTGDTMQFCFND